MTQPGFFFVFFGFEAAPRPGKQLNANPAGVTALVGAAGSSRATYPAWWGAAALALFPASLAVVWGLDTFLGWQ